MARKLRPDVVLLRNTQLFTKSSCPSSLSLSLSLPIHLLFGTVSYSSQQIRYSLSSVDFWALKREFHYGHQLHRSTHREISLTPNIYQLPASWNPPQQLDIRSSTSNCWLSSAFFNQFLLRQEVLRQRLPFSLSLLQRILVLQFHSQVAVSEERGCVGEDCSGFES